DDGILLFAGTHALPVLCNGTIRIEARRTPADVLDAARAFFARRGRGFSVVLRAHADDDLRGAAAAAGLTPMGDSPGMVLDRRLAPAVAPPGVDLRLVENAADAAAFAEV